MPYSIYKFVANESMQFHNVLESLSSTMFGSCMYMLLSKDNHCSICVAGTRSVTV